MEQFLVHRLNLRKCRLEDKLKDARDILERCKSRDAVLAQDVAKCHMTLKQCMSSIQSDMDQYITLSNAESNLLHAVLQLQMEGEDVTIELELILNLFSKTLEDKEENSQNKSHCKGMAKLPRLELCKFNGDLLKWTEFWERFDANVHSQNLKDVDKLAYLINSLEGVAKEVLDGLSITNENYDIAIKTLETRYGQKDKVIDCHYKALSRLKCCDESAASCRKNLDDINKHLRVLTALGENGENNHLRSIIMEKFPTKVLYELNLMMPLDKSVTSIRSNLETIIGAMKRAQKHNTVAEEDQVASPGTSTGALHLSVEKPIFRRGRKFMNSKEERNGKKWTGKTFHKEKEAQGAYPSTARGATDQSNRKRKPTSSTSSTKGKRSRLSCVFCDGDHYNDQCTKVRLADRRNELGDRYYLCFKTGHTVSECTTKRSCYYCKGRHNRALCPKKAPGREHSTEPATVNNLSKYVNAKTILQTAVAQVVQSNRKVPCRLIMDSGSHRSYITTRLAKRLNLATENEDLLLIFTFGAEKPMETISPSADIVIRTKRGIEKKIHVNVVPHITDRIAKPDIPENNLIDIVADNSTESEPGIDMLIGNDYYFSFMRSNTIQVDRDLYLVDTDFGWMLSGRLEMENERVENVLTVATYHHSGSGCRCYTEPDLPLRQSDIKFLWSLENIGITDSAKATREEEAVKHFNDTVEYDGSRYYVKWPWISYPPDVPTNYGLAYGRLKGLLQLLDENTIKEYDEILKGQLSAGVIEKVPELRNVQMQSVPPIHYLPHHIVKQTGKTGRIVYDASARVKDQLSLNECMYRGPCMLQDLTALLLNFRMNKVGILADVEKAFLQIGLQEEDREVTRFLWLKDSTKPVSDDNLVHLRFCRVPFGIISSPYLLTATIRYHIAKSDSELLKKVVNKCYVDNLVTGASTAREALQLFTESKNAFEELSMNLRDWVSNDDSFATKLPSSSKMKETKDIKVLGLLWDKEADILNLNVNEELWSPSKLKLSTKREVLRTLASVYDPCGIVAPVLMPMKLFLQELWKKKYKWDEPLSEDLDLTWRNIRSNLQEIKKVKIPRYIRVSRESRNELHCFTDAAKDSYAAVVYLRSEDGSTVKTSLLMSKIRVAPIEKKKKKNETDKAQKDELTIPKLELLGCFIGNRLLTYLVRNLEIPIAGQYLWTDSLIVLNWMNSTKLLPPFVTNRIEEIKQNVGLETYYVSTKENPADIATRPELWTQKKAAWLRGPRFLSKKRDEWPKDIHLDYHQKRISLSAVAEGLKELTPESVPLDIVRDEPVAKEKAPERVCLDVARGNEPTTHGESRVISQVQELRNLQRKYYREESEGHETNLSRNLGLFTDVDGLLRCKGRMTNTNWSYDMKYPVLLPRDCEFTEKVIREVHEKNYHVGAPHTLSLIRQQYWIPKGKSVVGRVLKRCPQCVKYGGGPYKLPAPPALPVERANYSTPFTYTGIDYLGPVYVSIENREQKRWICLFTCLAVRSIHMEVVKDLTADECLMALRRFTAVRGAPSVIVSDNATYFKLSSEILTSEQSVKNTIKWRFIPQLAPWHGAFYERLVGLVKHCMKRTLEKRLLNDTQMLTVIKEIETVINSRPLTRVDPESDEVLRPCDFLSLGSCLNLELPENCETTPTDTVTKQSLVAGWKRGQEMLNQFKSMFVNQYLTSLRERYQHSHKQPRVKSHKAPSIGDLVQIKGESNNRGNWRVGRIVHLLKSSDGQCRVAKVQVGDRMFTRSIGHLYPLELEESPAPLHSSIETANEVDIRNLQRSSDTSPTVMQEPEPSQEAQEVSLPERTETSESAPIVRIEMDLEDHGENNIEEQKVTEQTPASTLLPHCQEENDDMIPCPMEVDEQEDVENKEVDQVRDGVLKRTAAIRAREKIAEWTRQLFTTL